MFYLFRGNCTDLYHLFKLTFYLKIHFLFRLYAINMNLTSPNYKIPPGACFINTSHLSTGLPTEDYEELLECHLCFPSQREASVAAKHGEQRDQARLDTCIPDTRGLYPAKGTVGAELFFCRSTEGTKALTRYPLTRVRQISAQNN